MKHEWLIVKSDNSTMKETKYTQEKDPGIKLKSKLRKINLEGCHRLLRGKQIKLSEFEINFTDGIQFWCVWQYSRLY